jgi:hypothetical protein
MSGIGITALDFLGRDEPAVNHRTVDQGFTIDIPWLATIPVPHSRSS